MQDAPLLNAIARGPAGGRAFWIAARDGVRLRAAHWPADAGAARIGSVLLFPGRTEYVEKYGLAAADLGRRGYDVLTIDWRGQGMADRLAADPMLGHVGHFFDYQEDVSALLNLAEAIELPRPWFLIAHSMGGCIGLRAIHEELPVNAAVFSAPMWGMAMAPALRPVAWLMSHAAPLVGQSERLTPMTKAVSYVLDVPFAGNMLTKDEGMWTYMVEHARADSRLQLGGPSLNWLGKAMDETRALAALPAPTLPTVTFLGSDERIVDTAAIHARMRGWVAGRLCMVPAAEHEIMMEIPATRSAFFDEADALFGAQRGAEAG